MYVNYNKLTEWTPELVLAKLESSDTWLESALVALYKRQTELEKLAGCTIDDNDRGMQQADAKLFGEYARQLLSGTHLTAEQLTECRRPWHRGKVPVIRIGKYRKQIVRMIEDRARLAVQAPR
jgi:hypothetical protein